MYMFIYIYFLFILLFIAHIKEYTMLSYLYSIYSFIVNILTCYYCQYMENNVIVLSMKISGRCENEV